MIITKPEHIEYAEFYSPYIKAVQQNDLLDALHTNKADYDSFFESVDLSKGDYRYADGKWTLKEVLLHVCDAERIFAYRALRFARNDHAELHGFVENEYVPYSNAAARTLFNIHEEFGSIRAATLSLYKSFTNDMLMRKGIASCNIVTVRALGFIIVGHANHHLNVIKERYL